LRPRLQKEELTLTLNLPDALPRLKADARMVKQVMLNLLTNAVKFTPVGGSIEIATANSRGGELTVTVTDNGIGMSEEALSRLFHRFEQGDLAVDRRNRGLGLGLSIARALVEAHQGTIRATSNGPGEGSTFLVSFPVSEAGALHQPAAPVASTRKSP
jgi:signal transduction histidine kinase